VIGQLSRQDGVVTHYFPQETFPQRAYKKFFIEQACKVKMTGYCGSFINILSITVTGFHKRAKLFELNFFIEKSFCKAVKQGTKSKPDQ